MPILGGVGVKKVINGPIPYTPDANPLIGPAPGQRIFFEACVFSFGIVQAGGAGKHSSSDVHAALFGSERPTPVSDVKAGIRKHMRKKHACR